MYRVKTLVASAISILAATSVSAATYTFDLQNLNADNSDPGDPGALTGNELVITQGDLTGTFTGLYIEDAGYSDGALTGTAIHDANSVARNYTGLGVCNDGPCYTDDPYHTVDGASPNLHDMVQMAFSDVDGLVDVTLVSLTFGWVGDFRYGYSGTNGSFEIILDDAGFSGIDFGDSLMFSGLADDNIIEAYRSIGLYDLSGISGLTGSVFGVKAGDMGSWKLKSVVVDWTVPEVPLPAAGWLLLAGLGGLAAIRRLK